MIWLGLGIGALWLAAVAVSLAAWHAWFTIGKGGEE